MQGKCPTLYSIILAPSLRMFFLFDLHLRFCLGQAQLEMLKVYSYTQELLLAMLGLTAAQGILSSVLLVQLLISFFIIVMSILRPSLFQGHF